MARVAHTKAVAARHSCVDCHAGLVHKLPVELGGTAPGAETPRVASNPASGQPAASAQTAQESQCIGCHTNTTTMIALSRELAKHKPPVKSTLSEGVG
jgi:nitrate/TMAO reductase-like tetraheme cytochrome c subunit